MANNRYYRAAAKQELIKFPVEILECARNLLSKPGKWTQGYEAVEYTRSKYGIQTSPLDERASSFCLIGAVKKCYGNTDGRIICEELNQDIVLFHLSNYNDKTSKKGVMGLLDEVINQKLIQGKRND